MKNYIQVYDNVISKKHCDSLIEKFEVSKDQHVATDLENHRHFTEININQHEDWKMMVQGTYLHLRPMIQRYKDDCKIKEKLNVGDQLVKLNNTLLSKLSLEEVQLLFIKNQNSKRTLGIYLNS